MIILFYVRSNTFTEYVTWHERLNNLMISRTKFKAWKFGGFCSIHCVSHLSDYSRTKMPWFIMWLFHEVVISVFYLDIQSESLSITNKRWHVFLVENPGHQDIVLTAGLLYSDIMNNIWPCLKQWPISPLKMDVQNSFLYCSKTWNLLRENNVNFTCQVLEKVEIWKISGKYFNFLQLSSPIRLSSSCYAFSFFFFFPLFHSLLFASNSHHPDWFLSFPLHVFHLH